MQGCPICHEEFRYIQEYAEHVTACLEVKKISMELTITLNDEEIETRTLESNSFHSLSNKIDKLIEFTAANNTLN